MDTELPRNTDSPSVAPSDTLEFSVVTRSKEPIEKPDAQISSLVPWGNYTILLQDGNDNIAIYDHRGLPVEDFTPIASKEVVVDFLRIYTAATRKSNTNHNIPLCVIHSSQATHLNSNNRTRLSTRDVPQHIRTYLDRRIALSEATYELDHRKHRCIEVTTDPYRGTEPRDDVKAPTREKLSGSLCDFSNRYIVLFDTKSGFFIAYDTFDAQGKPLDPRNWKRYDMGYGQDLPEELRAYVVSLQSDAKKPVLEKRIDEKHAVVSLGDAITVHADGKQTEFTDKVQGVGRNVCVDPRDPSTFYYVRSERPSDMYRVRIVGEPATWRPEALPIPVEYASIQHLQIDPSGNVFAFQSGTDMVVMHKESLVEIGRLRNHRLGTFDPAGNIRAIDCSTGHLVVYKAALDKLAAQQHQKKAHALTAVDITALFTPVLGTQGSRIVPGTHADQYTPVRDKYTAEFTQRIVGVKTHDDLAQVKRAAENARDLLVTNGVPPDGVRFIMTDIEAALVKREGELLRPEAHVLITRVRTRLTSGLSLTAISEARTDLTGLESMLTLLPEADKATIRALQDEVRVNVNMLMKQQGKEVEHELAGLVEGVEQELASYTSIVEFDAWAEDRLPALKGHLHMLLRECPAEAAAVREKIVAARTKLNVLERDYRVRFEQQYAQIREKAADKNRAMSVSLKDDFKGMLDAVRRKKLKDRDTAQRFILGLPQRPQLQLELDMLAKDDPELAKELSFTFDVQLSQLLNEIERGTNVTVSETGQQMYTFGTTPFPKWEAHVEQKVARSVNVIFIAEERTKGPGIHPQDIYGDIGVRIADSSGQVTDVRLWENTRLEDEFRYGAMKRHGERVPATYMTLESYRACKQHIADWSRGEDSTIRSALREQRAKMQASYQQYRDAKAALQQAKDNLGEPDAIRKLEARAEQTKSEYRVLYAAYAQYYSQQHVSLLRRIDQVHAEPEVLPTNGKGIVPDWKDHWVMGPEDEAHLEDIAKLAKMQLHNREGIINLVGHAGTGKDVLVQMFSHFTKRPYFAIDCTKWTTEFELSEDIMLESRDGASQTIKVPSVVLHAIQTPGAIMYFNEINGMPEQAQIFLHALLDEKRQLTLKTSGGKTIRAEASVLFMSSMNPGYPGTYAPQLATRSRMVTKHIEYLPLYRAPDKDDTNPNKPYAVSEALRIARDVDSFRDMTLDANMKRNKFVQLWDRHVNLMQNGAPDLSPVQRFDMNVTLALVTFAHKLRHDFMMLLERDKDPESINARKRALPVTQPFTGREMRRCAYFLNQMPAEEKSTPSANPEALARYLIEQFYLTHMDRPGDRAMIATAMRSWTSSKRKAT